MKRIHVVTIAAANYAPKVRVLFDSLRRHRPEWYLELAVVDEPPASFALGALAADAIVSLGELGIPDWRRWAFCHTLIELATAIKPFLLRRLLARNDCAAAIYFDPDIVVFSPLDGIVDALSGADILLTPHMTKPATDTAGVVADEICTAQHGIYNLGFIAVAGREGRTLVDWWAERTYRFCLEDSSNGLYTDQRWIDFAPAFFEQVHVLRSPALNVAPWNLGARRVAGGVEQGITVDGVPLGFFHFSQIDKPVHDALWAAQPAVADLVAWYRREIRPRASEPSPAAAWSLGVFANGEPIRREQRLIYALRKDLQQVFPDPFATGATSYLEWWQRYARDAHPALFDPSARAAEIARLSAALTHTGLDVAGAAAAPYTAADAPPPAMSGIGRVLPWATRVIRRLNRR